MRRFLIALAWGVVTMPVCAQAQYFEDAVAEDPAAVAERLCRPTGPSAQGDGLYPADRQLTETAGAIESLLLTLRERGDPSTATLIQLGVVGNATTQPSALPLARYCAAAGELMRLSARGSQRQAINYLFAAYRLARGADEALASRTAYRLALVGVSEPGAEGARGTRGASEAPRREEPDSAGPDSSACDELTPDSLAELTPRQVSTSALACAAERSLAAGDRGLAALATLKLARIEGAYAAQADQAAEDRETFRGFARERTQEGLTLALALEGDPTQTELVGRLAEAAVDYGDRDSEALRGAFAFLRGRAGDPLATSLYQELTGRLAFARGDRAAARSAFQAAILAESRRAVPARLPRQYLLLAEADPDHRAAHVDTAYLTLENLRPLLPRLDPLTEESSFALYMRDVFAAAAESQLQRASIDDLAAIRRAQEIVETYRQAELQNAFGSECLPPRTAGRTDDLRPGETILYPLLFADRIEMLVVSRDASGGAPRYRRLPPNRAVGRAEVARLVEAVALPLSDGPGAASTWRDASRRLYDLLIAPVAERLTDTGVLAIVPDGPLRALPFAALIAPDGRYLVEATRLSTIPALAFSQPAGTTGSGGFSVVAASLQREVDLPVGTFGALAGTRAEAQIAVQYARDGRLIPDFTRADLVSALGRRTNVLHLATHAAFNGRSDRAFIVANGEVIRLTELRDMIQRTRSRGQAIDLIILSACETAVGDDEASMGLAGAAVQAGAASVIGSLWQVNDAGTAELMRIFYSRFADGVPRSEALRDAQLALIRSGGGNADPNIWAAFSLLGAWR